jgi:hypothetical protein
MSQSARNAIGRAQRKRWREAKQAQRERGMKNYWAQMTPKQRSAEILRRRTVSAARKAGVTK